MGYSLHGTVPVFSLWENVLFMLYMRNWSGANNCVTWLYFTFGGKWYNILCLDLTWWFSQVGHGLRRVLAGRLYWLRWLLRPWRSPGRPLFLKHLCYRFVFKISKRALEHWTLNRSRWLSPTSSLSLQNMLPTLKLGNSTQNITQKTEEEDSLFPWKTRKMHLIWPFSNIIHCQKLKNKSVTIISPNF